MPNLIRKVLIVLLVALVVIQFIPIDRDIPEPDDSVDFIYMTDPPNDVVVTLMNACYDCHSYETRYPWYANIAPVKFWLQDHVLEAREHLNFSEWGNYDTERKLHKLEEIAEEVEEGEMPLDSYKWMHGDARLDEEEISALTNWIKNQQTASAL
ncbi:MAG: heme-binding domain-containing protein [Cyclobacteriaceae bacterium]